MTPGNSESQREPTQQRGPFWTPITPPRGSFFHADPHATEPTSLFWDRTGLTTGQTRWYWLRAVSAEGNVSALVGPVTATAL